MVAEIVKHPRTHEQWPERQTKAVGQASSAWMFYSSLPSVYSEMLESLFLESSGHSILALLDSGCADIDGVIHRQGAMGPGLSMFGLGVMRLGEQIMWSCFFCHRACVS